jgi:hypothetical protein
MVLESPLLLALALVVGAGGVVKPCRAGTPEWIRAKEALDAASAKMRAVAPSGVGAAESGDGTACALSPRLTYETVVAAREAIEHLALNRCFIGTLEGPSPGDPAVPTLALVTWWQAGGERWLRSFLELDRPSPEVIIPQRSETFSSPTKARRWPLLNALLTTRTPVPPGTGGGIGCRTHSMPSWSTLRKGCRPFRKIWLQRSLPGNHRQAALAAPLMAAVGRFDPVRSELARCGQFSVGTA